MCDLLVKLVFLAMLADLATFEFKVFHSQQFFRQTEKSARDILKIDWKPISIFPEEAGRFIERRRTARRRLAGRTK